MRTPFNHSVRRIAREAANNFAKGRKRGGPDGCGCFVLLLFLFLIIVRIYGALN